MCDHNKATKFFIDSFKNKYLANSVVIGNLQNKKTQKENKNCREDRSKKCERKENICIEMGIDAELYKCRKGLYYVKTDDE